MAGCRVSLHIYNIDIYTVDEFCDLLTLTSPFKFCLYCGAIYGEICILWIIYDCNEYACKQWRHIVLAQIASAILMAYY